MLLSFPLLKLLLWIQWDIFCKMADTALLANIILKSTYNRLSRRHTSLSLIVLSSQDPLQLLSPWFAKINNIKQSWFKILTWIFTNAPIISFYSILVAFVKIQVNILNQLCFILFILANHGESNCRGSWEESTIKERLVCLLDNRL